MVRTEIQKNFGWFTAGISVLGLLFLQSSNRRWQ